ncbi:hypothetical protein [Leuconostoc carnosum]|uniref:hypothetical protein n=1 Tax=Leuconostoc carnosum TaxID=1252 RepID=UPI001238D775|nr:hypothetical protein [Leuconostoc carnosum]KAA8373669.1 hypothetical protein FE412_01780 [Leuconostoc carnosum]
MNDKEIENLVNNLTYWQKINLLITHYMTSMGDNREKAYDRALDDVTNDGKVSYAFQVMLNLGPTIFKCDRDE